MLHSNSASVTCPYCGSDRAHRHGTFPLKDGSRNQRFLCKSCGFTFHRYTQTPLNYLKKRDRWQQFLQFTVEGVSLRRMATNLGIHVATAFDWRHRLLSALAYQSQPILTGSVAASEGYISYSEKGNRRSDGPGAHGIRAARNDRSRWVPRKAAGPLDMSVKRDPEGRRPFRRFIDGKPSCVLLASASGRPVVAIIGQGQPTIEEMAAALSSVLRDVNEMWAKEIAPYAEACRRLGILHHNKWVWGKEAVLNHPCRVTERLLGNLYSWMVPFRGVATRYLENYLAWYRCAGPARSRPAEAVLLEASSQRVPGRAS